MQGEQRVNMYGLGFFCSEFGFGRHGEKELRSPSRLNLRKMLFSLSTCLNCFFGTHGDFKLSLGTCLVQNY